MGSYDFILDGISFSYSAISGYNTCPYSYKLSYIDSLRGVNNFYGEFGTLVHRCFEKYFTGELDAIELSQYYRNNYDSVVITPAPAIPYGLGDKYKLQGQEFFDNFSFNKDDYDIIFVEDKIDFDVNFCAAVARPDLLLRDKKTGKTFLYDYKTATPYWQDKNTGKEKSDKKKLEGYSKQMYLYTYALRTVRKIPIDNIAMWYPRLNKIVITPWVLEEEDAVVEWFDDTITKIRADERFKYDNSNKYFCSQLCGVRAACPYWK